MEKMRGDKALLKMVEAESLSAPSTVGDFCRRFDRESCDPLQDGINRTRLSAWSTQPISFFDRATIDSDGVLVPTGSQCSEGVEYNGHKRELGVHPLVVSLAETAEPLFIVNRAGASPSYEDAHIYIDKSIELSKEAGFKKIVLRGDTDFSQTKFLDGWNAQENVFFVFGIDASRTLVDRAESLPDSDWSILHRKTRQVEEDDERRKQPRLKDLLIQEKGYKTLELEREELAEISYKPQACESEYRVVILRKTIRVQQGSELLMPETRYFFYITNMTSPKPEEIVREANQRCNQENLLSHLKRGVHALRAPMKTLHANEAYMICTALAWTLKAWFALMGQFEAEEHGTQEGLRKRLLTMEFRTFLRELICIPALVIQTGRQLIIRALSSPPWLRHLLTALASLNE